ncbi:heavy metal translocating P-type ATPase [Gloeothece citriformis PCC 7424]|uniref:Heavy metal translocating P-type ATPase n=1 Tax=Gloeothece citriformis (strain PCC 7424) TaxID=65393 RepID=B7KAL6_GLOC7|nr:heavy metal translocating P-type ATPase [Gloeothece citriformis]ACK68688.1 heavy metal translocating P-type ATPase [Gloeothece citriformis PCC 7424]
MTIADRLTLVTSPNLEKQESQELFVYQPSENNYRLIHQIEGRWRIKIERIYDDPDYANNLQYLLESSKYVNKVLINTAAKSLIIEYDPDQVSPQRLQNYIAVSLEEADRGESLPIKTSSESSSHDINYWERLGIPIASLVLAIIALPLELPPLLVGGLIMMACLPAYGRALEGITEEKQLTVDFLDSLAITLSAAQGHFIPPAFMISLIESGEVIRDVTARSSERQTLDLLDSLGQYAWIEQDGVEVQVPLKEVQEGNIVIVYPGDLIPVDGKIIRGQALIDQCKLTGESVPVHRTVDDEVFASTLLVEGQLAILVERTGNNTRAGVVVELMKAAPVHDTRIENYAAKFANIAVLPTLLIGAGVFAFTGDLARATAIITLDFGTGIRVSVPTAVLAGLTYAARTGVYIRSGRAIEMLAKVDSVVFDKTGTLTQGNASVVDIQPTVEGVAPLEILCLAASAEQGLTHPVAHAIVQQAQQLNIDNKTCEEWNYCVGLGVVAKIDGRQILVGSSRFMKNENIDITASEQFKTGGVSLAYVARDGILIGVIMYADPIRTESPGVITELHRQGISTHMLTGDVQRVADAVAQELGMHSNEVHAQAFPERKVEVVQELKSKGKTVAFIGDGINDSAALAYADVSISFAAGSDIARETADVVLMDDDLSGLTHAIAISKQVMDIVYQNAFIVGIPNFGALVIGVLFALDPILAIVINNGSAILAGLNGLRPTLGADKKTYRQETVIGLTQ